VGFGLGPDLIEFPVQQVLLIGDARQHDHRGVYPGFRALLEFIQSINNGGFEWNIGKRDQGLGSRGDDLKGSWLPGTSRSNQTWVLPHFR
jgi:hypothetical protein